ncbi:DNA methyltransferase [Conservatibacter flavescens]|uniref:Methyltransferase n=1 Tax=Conservatibacter flavescens TaxID=28161 RepID=A0A2M8S3H9_9PAST|nr:DNA methyltransferase [Conservatibacter flavescens]PJG85628.1 restriction endonuclease subunit M [Conservatibacter flavescens]
MLTKEYILKLKKSNPSELSNLINDNFNNIKSLIFILEKLGFLNKQFDPNIFIGLISHPNEQIRVLTIKNLGKINNIALIPTFMNIVENDESSLVRREAISSIGRTRNENSILFLCNILLDKDPKIVGQAIRALLVFKGNKEVDEKLKKLSNHKNEMIKSVIYKEYFSNKKTNKSILKHTETYDFLKNVVVNGDVQDILKFVPDESIHLTFTSPPYYNARDYSIYSSYEDYLDFLEDVFLDTYRVTKEGRFLVVNTSPIIIPRISRAHSSKRYPIPFDLHTRLVNIGWEFIDDIIWLKPEYSVKNRIGGFQQHRKPLAYKPNTVTEYLMVYRKNTDKLLDWNMKQYDYNTINESKVQEGFETTNVWEISPKSDKVHSAVFPMELCKRVIEYYSYKGDLVFDPFAGSGTLGRTAKFLDRYFFLTEKEKNYFEYMKTFQVETALFEENKTKFISLNEFKGIVNENN